LIPDGNWFFLIVYIPFGLVVKLLFLTRYNLHWKKASYSSILIYII